MQAPLKIQWQDWGQGQAWGELEPLILKGHKNIIYLDVWWKVEQFEVPW